MFIRDQRLTVRLTGDRAAVTVGFTVVFYEQHVPSGGFYEIVGLKVGLAAD